MLDVAEVAVHCLLGAATQLHVKWTSAFARDFVWKVALVREIAAIQTNRLSLVSLSRDCLLAMLKGDYVAAGAYCEYTISPDSSLLHHLSIQRRLALIERDPEQHPWMYRAIVRKCDNIMVGHISFHHKAPDPDLLEYSGHAAELGYAIDVGHRRKGYARESVLAMMEWANKQKVETFCLSISPENMPSLKLAESMGFRRMSERMDETDGLEYVYIADMNTIRQQAKVENEYDTYP
jgi:ribosomal-protein-alanine N-acetyltransferase